MASANTRLTRLLNRGFYPLELPPSFRTSRFDAVRHSFSPPKDYSGSTLFFDGATFQGALRSFGIINPANYFLLSSFIATNWREIAKVYRLSSSSGSRPTFPNAHADGRSIHDASLSAKRKSQQHLTGSYPIILSLDINRFYGSIYTHSIPWVVLGKPVAKRLWRTGRLKRHWSDTLDTLVRNCNQRQTVGIPIGPDTSRIISELVLSRIDSELTASGTGISSGQVFHNIDDYQIGEFDVGMIERAQSHFVRTISLYELRLNDFKTSVDQGVDFSPSDFRHNFDILRVGKGEKFVEHFFELLYSQATMYPHLNVMGYALKRFARPLARNSKQVLVREYLQRLIFAAPHQTRWILPLLLGIYRQTGVDAIVQRVLTWGIQTCTRRNDVGNLLWFLHAAICLNVKLRSSVCGECIGMSNELVDLVLLHGRHLGLFSFRILDIRSRYMAVDFQSPAWLPLYEVQRQGWDNSVAFNKIGGQEDAHKLYEHLRINDVEFYRTTSDVYSVEAFEVWHLKQADFDHGAAGIDFAEEVFEWDFFEEEY